MDRWPDAVRFFLDSAGYSPAGSACESVEARKRIEGIESENAEEVARPEGFEPTALCFGGTRSIHLSYGRAVPNSLPNSPLTLHRNSPSSNKLHNHTANERQP